MNRFLAFGALVALLAACELEPPPPNGTGGEGGGGAAGVGGAVDGGTSGTLAGSGSSLAGRAGSAQAGGAGLAGAGGRTPNGGTSAGTATAGVGATNAGGRSGEGAVAGSEEGGEAGSNGEGSAGTGAGVAGAQGGSHSNAGTANGGSSAGSTSAGGTSAGKANGGAGAGTGGSAGTAEPLPTTIVVQDLEDTYVANDQASTNFGNAGELLIDADPVVFRTLIRSPGLGGMPSGATVISATLTLECYDEGGEVRAARVTSGWSENTVTWDTAPSFSGSFRSLGEVAEGRVSFDLTSFVQSWANGTENYGVVLYTLDTEGFGGSDYCSAESSRTECSDSGKRPSLSITWQ